MARATSNFAEAAALSRLMSSSDFFGIVGLTLANGAYIEGAMRRLNVGNNAGAGGSWTYHGSVTLQLLTGDVLEVDLLDVRTATNVTNDRAAEYERAGLIEFVDPAA